MKAINPLPTLVLNVPEIANKSPGHVARILGNASSTDAEPGQQTTKSVYMSGSVEVTFKENRATRITVRGARDLPFDASALRKLGLPPKKPSGKTPNGALKWDRLCGIADVTIYPGTRHPVSHIFVSVVPMADRRKTRTSRGWLTLTHG